MRQVQIIQLIIFTLSVCFIFVGGLVNERIKIYILGGQCKCSEFGVCHLYLVVALELHRHIESRIEPRLIQDKSNGFPFLRLKPVASPDRYKQEQIP